MNPTYRSKYLNVKTTLYWGSKTYVFPSKLEARRGRQLLELQEEGKIFELNMQVPYTLLTCLFYVNNTQSKKTVKYVADFVYKENGYTIIEDTKSLATSKKPDYIIKKKLMINMLKQDEIFREYFSKNNVKDYRRAIYE